MTTAIKNINELPDWFDLKNYEEAKDLTAYGWFWQFAIRAKDYIFFPDLMNPEAERQLHTGIIPLLEKREDELPYSVDPAVVGTRVVFSAGKGHILYEYLPLRLWAADFEMVAVDLAVPDDLIIDSFQKWLAERRKRSSPTPGHSRNKAFTKDDFKSWWLHGVLPYIDLTRWASLEGRRITYPVYGEALFPGRSQGNRPERVRKTTRLKAMNMMGPATYLLAIQAHGEKNHS